MQKKRMLSNQNQGAKVVNIIQLFSKIPRNKEYEKKNPILFFNFLICVKFHIKHIANSICVQCHKLQ